MKLNIFIFRNKKLKCTGQPYFDDHEPEVFAKSFERMLQTASEEKVYQYENVDLYHLATYDDESMVLTPVEPLKILDCTLVLDERGVRTSILKQVEEEKKECEDVTNGC